MATTLVSVKGHPAAGREAPDCDALQAMPRGVYWREIGAELTKLARNRAYSFSVIGFPVVFYLMFGSLGSHAGPGGHVYARYLLAGYACFGAMGAALFGIGNGLAYERGHGWLELKRASPMPPMAYLVAKLAASLVFSLSITLLLAALGPLIAGHPVASILEIVKLLGVVAVGTIPFASLGLLFGLAIPPSAGPGLVNLIYLPLSFCGGLWMPIEQLPNWLQAVAHYLPSYWFSRLALHVLGFPTPALWVGYAVLAGYTVVFLAISARIWASSEAKA
jgi:ABC-2 type transport system permease protein